MKKILICMVVVASIIGLNAKNNNQTTNITPDFTAIQKLGYAERIIEKFYVDSIDSDKMVEEGILAMLKTLDPHSTYTNPEETKDLTTPLQGNFSGIGIQFNMVNDTLYVIQTTVGGPSEKVGIQPGDKILMANDSVLSGVKRKNSDILNILRGPKGTEVLVEVLRKNTPETIKFRIKRDDIPLFSVDAAYAVNDSTGYIRVSRFAETTAGEVADALKMFKEVGIKNLIIDLEDNGGGYLNAAVDMASLFLPKNSLIVFTDAPKIERVDHRSKIAPLMPEGRLVVSVNQNSASSSEIFTGAIQDYDRGVVVGRRTFGKGLVQRPFPFPDGSMIRLTVSKYYTPSGRSIQKPYRKGDATDYYLDIYNRYKGGEFMNADSIHFNDSLKVFTLNTHRPVYGGGGIMPDLFVPVDTSNYSTYYRDLMANSVFARFVINYVDTHRNEIKKIYPTDNDFIENFVVTDQMLSDLIAMGEKDGVALNEEGFNISRNAITAMVKGLIGRDVWDMNTYFKIVNPELSPVYRQSLDIINSPTSYYHLLQPGTAL